MTTSTTTTKDAAREFLDHRRIAVTGVSHQPKGHGSNAVYTWMRDHGYEVFAVNPHVDRVEGDLAYPTLQAIPGGVDAVVIGTAPEHAQETMEQALDAGVRSVWMHRSFGGGSVSDDATAWGRAHGLTVIDGGCPIMFHPDGDGFHHAMCHVLTWTGKVPRTV
ncbi:CoA-binding protein [Phycicoccus sp.]|uniref:CoA-binding protein n=1 Tax=Phycicoccus sp. TaxID=1902410 RepID=UPI002B7E0610|nr:CoA-binding protein [Phycicoccus sp.]HMM93802.1 CoA-binding protein [Phycicoccus sp.]